jgi:hypothetical protein
VCLRSGDGDSTTCRHTHNLSKVNTRTRETMTMTTTPSPLVRVGCDSFFLSLLWDVGVCVRISRGRSIDRRMVLSLFLTSHENLMCVCACAFSAFCLALVCVCLRRRRLLGSIRPPRRRLSDKREK